MALANLLRADARKIPFGVNLLLRVQRSNKKVTKNIKKSTATAPNIVPDPHPCHFRAGWPR
jgi:hypothetical protein